MHQHGGRPGGSGRGASGGGASDVGSRNWEIAHGSGNKTGGRGGENADCKIDCTEEIVEPENKIPEVQAASSDTWRLWVNDNEWDLSDVEDIDRPCREYCYWILQHKNGKKTRISGNVILEEI